MKQAWQKGGNGGGQGDEGQKVNAAQTSVAPSGSQNEAYLLREPRAQAGAALTLVSTLRLANYQEQRKKWLLVLFLFSLCF